MYVDYNESFDAADMTSAMIGVDDEHIDRCPVCDSMNVVDGYHAYQAGKLVCLDCGNEHRKV